MGVARGNGRLGWHIECFAMTRRYLSELFAIHGGGADLLFPHHEAEYGSAGLPARYWIRTALVRQDGRKMSKSLGNMTFVSYLLLTYSGTAIRLALLRPTNTRKALDAIAVTIAAFARASSTMRTVPSTTVASAA